MKKLFKALFYFGALGIFALMCYQSYIILFEYVEIDTIDMTFLVFTAAIFTNIFKTFGEE